MYRIARVLIMLLRALAVITIVLGMILWSGRSISVLPYHIALGFATAAIVLALAILGFLNRAIVLGLLGLILAVLLPVIGLRQFPLVFGSDLGPVQIAHIVISLAALGVAESLHGRIRKSNA